MNIRKSTWILILFSALAFQSCGNKIDSKLNDLEKIIDKWSKETEKGDFSEKDCAKIMSEFQNTGADDLKNATDITPEQMQRAMELSQRMSKLIFPCMSMQLR